MGPHSTTSLALHLVGLGVRLGHDGAALVCLALVCLALAGGLLLRQALPELLSHKGHEGVQQSAPQALKSSGLAARQTSSCRWPGQCWEPSHEADITDRFR